ncbi:MAG: response regulator [Gammaproteobacteria bacterium]|nr:response regulator [Gammaproteobacteria bacterium]
MKKALVYIIDNDKNIRESMCELLSEKYQTIAFESGDEALKQYHQKRPEIILLDIRMPDKDGYEICKEFRALDPDEEMSIIFMSNKDSQDERMRAYYLGGDDFLIKPFSYEELLAKLKKVDRYHKQQQNLQEQHSIAQDMAFQAMTEASQYGIVLQFIKETFISENETQLATAVFQTLSKLNISGSVQFRMASHTSSFRAPNQTCNPIEEEVFELIKNRGRIFDFQNKTIFNDHHASILVKDMPLDDEIMYGRFRDILAAVVEGVEARLIDIQRKNALMIVMNDIRSTITLVEKQFQKHEISTVDTMEKLMLDMESGFNFLNLSDEQEDFFLQLIENSMKQLVSVYMEARSINEQLDGVYTKLSTAMEHK